MHMSKTSIPSKLFDYNVYSEGNRLLGIDAEVELPTFTATTSELSGAGVMGSIDDPSPGLFGSMELGITFHAISEYATDIYTPRAHTLTLRANQSARETTIDGGLEHSALKIVMRGIPKEFASGKAKAGEPTGTAVKFELSYIKIERNGMVLIELDKFNYIYVVNGFDYMAEVRANI